VATIAEGMRRAGIAVGVDEADVSAGYGQQLVFETAPGSRAGRADEGLTVLVETGLLRISGADAASFLQNQLTNDVGLAATDRAVLAGICNPKGRLIASFAIWREAGHGGEPDSDGAVAGATAGGDAFWLACSRDMTAALARRLRMFVLRSKVRITTHDHDALAIGLLGGRTIDAAADALVEHDSPFGRTIVGLPPPQTAHPHGLAHGSSTATVVARAIAIASVAELGAVAARATARGLEWIGSRNWRWQEVQSATARITAATSERFVPQMVNFDRTGGVSFTKGCYPGQEVVARSHYRGTTKRRMFVVGGKGPVPAPGADLDPASGSAEPAGAVVLAARDPADETSWAMLAEARIDAAHAGLGWSGAPTTALPLPYPLIDAPGSGSAAGDTR
jgi:folate-binding protein YgfZ